MFSFWLHSLVAGRVLEYSEELEHKIMHNVSIIDDESYGSHIKLYSLDTISMSTDTRKITTVTNYNALEEAGRTQEGKEW